jgi:hypothetical protein
MSNIVLSSFDLHKGKTGSYDRTARLTAPIQMLTNKQKNQAWKEQNLDWLEHIGMMQIQHKAKRIAKYYNLAEGIIDKTDYIPDQSEHSSIIEMLTKENESPLELRFYPIIPTVINVLAGEFSKRNNKVLVKAIDEYSINEMLEKKKEMVTKSVVQMAQAKIAQKLSEQGIDLNSEEAAQAMEQVQSLPEIQNFFNKSYRGIAEQWATHELEVAEERFKMFELENLTFKDSLITGEEYWHIRIAEDSYEVERWHPINTFCHKSPDVRYVSEGNYAGRVLLMSIADSIDRYGYLMSEEQIKSLETIIKPRADFGNIQSVGATQTTDFYNPAKGKNDQIDSIHWNQSMGMKQAFDENNSFIDWLKTDDSFLNQGMLRVVEVYWKSQKRVGHLKQIDENGNVFEDIVGDEFVVVEEPIYDDTIMKKKSKDNLIYGQHIDWIWVNEVWKGIKIGLNFMNGISGTNPSFEPIYLDVKPLEFQFKGDESLYGCKLPVEGIAFGNQITKKSSLVDQMKSFQIGYNLVNNQIVDMLADEVGNVIMFDQNMIPRTSLDGSWGKHNFVKAYQVMKDFGFLPIDSTMQNTELPTNFSNTQAVDMSKTNQLVTRIKMAEYFKNEALAVVGITPQRLGTVTSSESATGVQAAVNNSYAQTEMYFVNHINFLMPRVKQMILNAAQFINSNRKDIRIAYMNSNEENVYFQIEGTKLLLADFNVWCTAKPDQRAVLEKLKELAFANNTAGASIFDLAKIIESNSVSEIMNTLKSSVEKMQEQQQQQYQSQEAALQQKIEADQIEAEKERQYQAQENELDRANERYVAEIKAMGYAEDTDLNQNNIPDPLEVAKFNAELGKHTEDILFKREQEAGKRVKEAKDLQLKAKQIQLERERFKEESKQKEQDRKIERENMKNDLQIARENRKGRSKSKPK